MFITENSGFGSFNITTENQKFWNYTQPVLVINQNWQFCLLCIQFLASLAWGRLSYSKDLSCFNSSDLFQIELDSKWTHSDEWTDMIAESQAASAGHSQALPVTSVHSGFGTRAWQLSIFLFQHNKNLFKWFTEKMTETLLSCI